MKTMFVLLLVGMYSSLAPKSDPLSYDFGTKGEQNWYVLNDGVMGGLSQGTISFEKNLMRFEGKLSFENNGGFASIRSPWKDYDLSEFEGVRIRYRNTGVPFAITMEMDRRWFMPYFKGALELSEKFTEVSIPFSDFEAYRVGRATGVNPDASALASVIRLGLISNAKSKDDFVLEVDYIGFY